MIIIYSVPHTGTHFAKSFLEFAKLRFHNQYHVKVGSSIETFRREHGDAIPVVPFRDPHDGLVTHLSNIPRYYHPDNWFKKWEALFKVLEDCPEYVILNTSHLGNRVDHIKQVAAKLNYNGEEARLVNFAKAWKPQNQRVRKRFPDLFMKYRKELNYIADRQEDFLNRQ